MYNCKYVLLRSRSNFEVWGQSKMDEIEIIAVSSQIAIIKAYGNSAECYRLPYPYRTLLLIFRIGIEETYIFEIILILGHMTVDFSLFEFRQA